MFGGHIERLSVHFGNAPVLVERNNHGHAVLLWIHEFGQSQLLKGLDGSSGWLTSGNGKALCVDNAADMIRDGATRIRDAETLAQLAQLEGSTLAAPQGQHDDRAMAHMLALAAVRWCGRLPDNIQSKGDPFKPLRTESEFEHTLVKTDGGGVRFGLAPKHKRPAGKQLQFGRVRE